MKVCPLASINIQSGSRNLHNVLLTRDVFYTESVFLYRHSPTEHTVNLVGSILLGISGLYDLSGV